MAKKSQLSDTVFQKTFRQLWACSILICTFEAKIFVKQRPEEAFASSGTDCQKTMKSSFVTEQQEKSEGGKKPPSRSIKRFSELFEVQKTGLSGAKRLFRHADKRGALTEKQRVGSGAHFRIPP